MDETPPNIQFHTWKSFTHKKYMMLYGGGTADPNLLDSLGTKLELGC